MFRKALVVVAFAAACQGSDDDSPITVTFRVVDQTGTPVSADVSCWGECTCDFECGGGCTVDGRLQRRGDEYVCSISNDVTSLYLEARSGDRYAALTLLDPGASEIPDVAIWLPTVTFEEMDGILEVTWTPLPPAPGVDWETTLRASARPEVRLARPATTTSAAMPAEDFEDFVAPQLSLYVAHRSGAAELLQDVTNLAVPHVPNVPPSRGAACEVTQETEVTGGDPIRETVAYPAGACPLTDGVPFRFDCGNRCSIVGAVIDLGAEMPVRRVYARSTGGSVELSRDRVTFQPIENGEPLPAPSSARYVRILDSEEVREVSVFAP